MEAVKQVIVIRKDLRMRRGKEIAQGSHASMAWLTKRLEIATVSYVTGVTNAGSVMLTDAERAWIEGSFAKVVCQVDSLEALLAVLDAALRAGLQAHAITDAGRTEFHGEPTTTCIAIGPDYVSRIDPVTSGLTLY